METDQELIARVLEGDRDARNRFAERYACTVWSVIRRSVGGSGSEENCEEIFSEVFARLFDGDCRRLRQWRGEGSFRAYLATVTRNCGRDHFRKAGSIPRGYIGVSIGVQDDGVSGDAGAEVDPASDGPGPLEWLLRSERQSEVQAAVQATMHELSVRDRELLERKHYAAESYKAMAEATGLTVNQVGVYLHRAEKRLQKMMREHFAGVIQ